MPCLEIPCFSSGFSKMGVTGVSWLSYESGISNINYSHDELQHCNMRLCKYFEGQRRRTAAFMNDLLGNTLFLIWIFQNGGYRCFLAKL